MSALNETTVEDAALEWSCLRAATHRQIRLRQGYCGQVGEQTRCARSLTPPLSQEEREKDEAERWAVFPILESTGGIYERSLA